MATIWVVYSLYHPYSCKVVDALSKGMFVLNKMMEELQSDWPVKPGDDGDGFSIRNVEDGYSLGRWAELAGEKRWMHYARLVPADVSCCGLDDI